MSSKTSEREVQHPKFIIYKQVINRLCIIQERLNDQKLLLTNIMCMTQERYNIKKIHLIH